MGGGTFVNQFPKHLTKVATITVAAEEPTPRFIVQAGVDMKKPLGSFSSLGDAIEAGKAASKGYRNHERNGVGIMERSGRFDLFRAEFPFHNTMHDEDRGTLDFEHAGRQGDTFFNRPHKGWEPYVFKPENPAIRALVDGPVVQKL